MIPGSASARVRDRVMIPVAVPDDASLAGGAASAGAEAAVPFRAAFCVFPAIALHSEPEPLSHYGSGYFVCFSIH